MLIINNGIQVPYFVLEGLDGVGKSSLIPLIKNALEDKGYSVHLMQEPAVSVSDPHLPAWLTNSSSKDPLAVAMVQFASRIQQFNKIKKIKMTGSDIILADRSYLSTCAYQGEDVANALLELSNLPNIDMAFHIKVPYAVAMERLESRNYNDPNDVTNENKYDEIAHKYDKLCGYYIENDIRLVAANNIYKRILGSLETLNSIELKKGGD